MNYNIFKKDKLWSFKWNLKKDNNCLNDKSIRDICKYSCKNIIKYIIKNENKINLNNINDLKQILLTYSCFMGYLKTIIIIDKCVREISIISVLF